MAVEKSKVLNQKHFLRESELVPSIVPFSSSTLWRLVRDGAFPRPVRLSRNVIAWRVDDVHLWIVSRPPISERQRRYTK